MEEVVGQDYEVIDAPVESYIEYCPSTRASDGVLLLGDVKPG
jgi:hypothetical protein